MAASPFDPRIVNALGVLVAVVWAISFVADIFVGGYEPSPFIHLAMMTVVGAAVGSNILNRKDED